jgi:hypothetical protein
LNDIARFTFKQIANVVEFLSFERLAELDTPTLMNLPKSPATLAFVKQVRAEVAAAKRAAKRAL